MTLPNPYAAGRNWELHLDMAVERLRRPNRRARAAKPAEAQGVLI